MTLLVQNLAIELGGAEVVRDVSARFAPGTVTAIIGANGTGKTSLLRALAGLIPPHRGEVQLNDMPLAAMPLQERARRISYLPQNGVPAWNVTVRELVALGRLAHRAPFFAPSTADETAIDAALSATDTAHLADRTIDALSGGELARVKIARVLAGDPDWILADEPLANLDPPHERDLLTLFAGAAATGKGVIVVLHQLSAAARIADALIIMKDGAVIAQGKSTNVLTPENLEAAFGIAFDLVQHGDRIIVTPQA